ncbi:MAG: mitochondrial carrier domain-containing protein [Podila humilis]|nr:MAG: mitochondrial carrier domain-containing protein [Podila humilis]
MESRQQTDQSNHSTASSSLVIPSSSSASPSTTPENTQSSIAHLFAITPHDQHLIQEWAWKNRTVLAASSAAVCSVLSGFPFDSVKTRMQTHSYSSIMDCVRKTYAEERLGGFFRGMIPPLITVSIIKSISFSVYEGSKATVRENSENLQGNTIPSLIGLTFISGSVAGTVVAMMSSPLELVKLQRQLEKLMAMHAKKEAEIASLTGDALLREGLATEKKHGSGSAKAMERFTHGSVSQHGIPPKEEAGASSWRTAKAIVQKKGWLGLYSGVNLHIARDMLGTGIYFSSYETIKRLMSETIEHIRPHPAAGPGATATTTHLKGPGPMVHFFAGGLCGVFSWLVVFPIDLVKSVIQKEVLATHPKYIGALDCARDIVRREGVRGLYRGLSVTCYRAMPIHSLNFLVYEAVMDYVKRLSGHEHDAPALGGHMAPVTTYSTPSPTPTSPSSPASSPSPSPSSLS